MTMSVTVAVTAPGIAGFFLSMVSLLDVGAVAPLLEASTATIGELLRVAQTLQILGSAVIVVSAVQARNSTIGEVMQIPGLGNKCGGRSSGEKCEDQESGTHFV